MLPEELDFLLREADLLVPAVHQVVLVFVQQVALAVQVVGF